MSDNTLSTFNQYFSFNSSNIDFPSDFTTQLEKTSNKIQNLKIDNSYSASQNEPEVCKLFVDETHQSKDSTAAFFDLIGNNHGIRASEVISGLGSSSITDDGYVARVAVGSESDRRRDAWIPNEKTRQCLISVATTVPGTYIADQEMLTKPGVLLEEDLSDPVTEAVSACLGEAEAAQRHVLTANDVTQDERGLRELVQSGLYKAAINLTARLLTIYGQGRGRAGHPSKHSPYSLQLWFTRIALLVKTRAFNIASAEAELFGPLDQPDLYYQFYPEMYGSRPGSMVSFSFRLLLAELPMHCNKPRDSLTKLFKILSIVQQILKNLKEGLSENGNPIEISESDRNDSLRLWNGREIRVMHSIVNCALVLKDYELAMELLGQLTERETSSKQALLSALGRLHLQLGDVSGAEACFNEASSISEESPNVRELVDRGLLAIAQNLFDEAYIYFQQASMLEPSNIMILNNMGVCLLYGGNLKEAITVLESAVASNPVHALQEQLLLNLCTLYDMESSKGRMKKFALLRQISRYQADAPATILEKLYG